ncbi:AT-rich interactive domain-containing protein 5A isoform X2 [Genypterus blacodes]|uniref:AT-rich interactive domain-containing protein 5A isoform X2 n=1 Tax=Genypterus blacodes TaxID=154954 RepID=UPI003F7574E5
MEEQSEMSQQTVASEEEIAKTDQVSLVIEIQDSPSATECEEEARPCAVKMEEKSFVSGLYCFMKDKGSPIERIPHLGFKQINLWRIYKAVEKLGGYDSVTARRLWKNVYDELGGSPGSTSAATCTRRHYERLVLPFERHIKGEEDKPLPPSKPRKPYKRNLDGKVSKTEGKRKRTDRDVDSELITKGSPDAGIHTHSSLWAATSDRRRADCSQPSRGTGDLCTPVYTCASLLQVPTSSPWIGHIPSAAGEVISPLEKKKRVAQASLNLPPSPQSEDRDRPTVIRCSPSPALASSIHNCNSSEGSPLPLSSSSSRSASPDSVSSEDGPAGREDKPASNTELDEKCFSTIKNTPRCKEESGSEKSKDPAGQRKNITHISSQTVNTGLSTADIKDCAWKHMHKAKNVSYSRCQLPTSSSCTVKSDWVPASTSSFSKVIPKYTQLLRPAPIRPSYKVHPSRLTQQDDSLTCVKKMINVAPWLYHAEKWEKSRMPKPPLTQQSLSRSSTPLPVSYVLGDSRHQAPLHPEFLPSRMRLPQSQPMYGHIPVNPMHSALIGSAIYSYPYPIPVWSPQTGYTLPAMNSVYPHKL